MLKALITLVRVQAVLRLTGKRWKGARSVATQCISARRAARYPGKQGRWRKLAGKAKVRSEERDGRESEDRTGKENRETSRRESEARGTQCRVGLP